MATRLYVWNLPYFATVGELEELFKQAGEVESARVVTDRETGRPRGFGFVEMGSDEATENAIRMFDGYTMDGRQIKVNPAMEREAVSYTHLTLPTIYSV